MAIEKWLESCPSAVVARVVSDVQDIRSLAITAELYPSDTLVVVPIESLSSLHKMARDNLSRRAKLLSDALDLIEEQLLHIEAAKADIAETYGDGFTLLNYTQKDMVKEVVYNF